MLPKTWLQQTFECIFALSKACKLWKRVQSSLYNPIANTLESKSIGYMLIHPNNEDFWSEHFTGCLLLIYLL